MNEFRVKMTVDAHDLDYNGVAKTSSVMRYIQSAAELQLSENGMSYSELKKRERAFVLSRIKLEVLKPLYAYAPITAITFPCESRGYSFLRCYSLESDGAVVARAASVWALVDTGTRSLVRVNDFELGLTTLPPLDIGADTFRLPSTLTDVGGYGVHYGDVDQNRHMNNTKYPDMYSSFMPLENKMIRSISIKYLNEAVMGDKLRVERAVEGDVYCFRTVRGDGKVNSEAQILLSEI